MLPTVYFVSVQISSIGDLMESCSEAPLSRQDFTVRALQKCDKDHQSFMTSVAFVMVWLRNVFLNGSFLSNSAVTLKNTVASVIQSNLQFDVINKGR